MKTHRALHLWSIYFSFYTSKFSSVQSSVMSDSLWPHEPQHFRPPCPSPTPGVYPNSCPLSQWCHPTISSSVVPVSCLKSFPTSESFQRSQLFASGGQSIGVSASTSVLTSEDPGLVSFRMGWLDLLAVQGTLKSLSNITLQKHQFFGAQLSLCERFNSHIHTLLLEKP